MATDLLERDEYLLALEKSLRQAVAGHGRTVLVSGEAGIGKTSLVERFVARAPAGTRTLWGACEALFTPSPLGPLYDIAQQTQGPLRARLEGHTNRAALFAAVLDELSQAPTILIIEDVHWADEATLDLLKYLARRIARTPALLILTWRDDEIDKRHPLRLVLGDLPARDLLRLRLLPLSKEAVATLAHEAARPAGDLYIATGGNPFFLTEALASDAPGVPTNVADAVLARIARRSPKAQRLLELVAVVPNRIESWLLEAISANESAHENEALEECLAAGILRLDGDAVAFRHELARLAVENTLSPTHLRALHAQVLHALLACEDEPTSLARLTHHAAAAGDATLVLRFAPAAARQASAQGAHREAVAHYQSALRYATGLDPERRASLLEALSHELYLAGRIRDAVQPCEAALALWQSLKRQEQAGHSLRRLSRLSWFLGYHAEAERYGLAAVELLETLPPGHELAMAYANLSNLRMVESNIAATKVWGERAIELAERIGDNETLSYALNNLGTARLEVDDDGGRAQLERSLAIALEHGYEEPVARAYANLSAERVGRRDYAQAEVYIREGLAYCAEHDLGSWGHYLQGHRSRVRLAQGDWEGAEEDTTAILSVPWEDTTNRTPALLVLGQVRARRGDPGAQAALDEAHAVALAATVLRAGVAENFVSIAAARAEWRWLQGDREGCVSEANVGLQQALKHPHPWYIGDAAIWLWRCGALHEAPPNTFAPYARQIAGDWRAAADAWEQLGCPYEQALALLDGDEAAQREALDIFERLGAAPAAEIARKRLRAAGVRGLPRGPRPSTQANSVGLTPRQFEILLLLAEGLHNSEIADRLSTTPKTVEHHVSAVLAKLQARSRSEAVSLAHQLGIIPATTEPHWNKAAQ
jgi:DNA-binding CsgD family transcriptional regulator/tetratricopeptide (TPR) repeat protein